MTGVQRIVDDVRALIAARDQTLSDRLRLLAGDYAQACEATEARLRRCEELARSGYSGEAIYLAELDPPLLDVMSALSFPERRAWGDLTSMYGLPEPSPLSVARAKEFNKAYADYAGVEHLVVRLRHLSRGRAPMAQRASVLRELCNRDPNCPTWPDQLIALETELRAELTRAIDADLRAGDRARMFEYYSALSAPGWRRPAPPPVIARAAAECLPKVLARLAAAIGRSDLGAAHQVRTEWDRIARDAMLTPDHLLAERGANWCARLDSLLEGAEDARLRQEAIETLRDALHRGGTEDELTTAYNRVRAYGSKVSRPLAEQYQARMAKYENRRQNRQAVLGIVGILVGAMILITFLVLVVGR
jgi:hypothetical protein